MPITRNPRIVNVVLSVSRTDWSKVAMIVARSLRECDAKDIATTHEEITAAIDELCDAGKLEAKEIVPINAIAN
jgi:hypothetical protein